MISFNIRCGNDHVFEAWFNSGAAYEEQAAAGEVACPVCGDTHVGKAPMAPRINSGKSRQPMTNVSPAAVRQALAALHQHIEKNSDDVGDRFAEEARRIHYGETEKRNIRGVATDDEARELVEENIEFCRLPPLPRTDA